MRFWSPETSSPTQRWGIVFLIGGVAYDLLVPGGTSVAQFCVDALALIVGGFLGPFTVDVACHLKQIELSGLLLGIVTFIVCLMITLPLAYFFRSYV